MSMPRLRIQSGIAVPTRPSGKPEENDRRVTDAVRQDRIARPRLENAFVFFFCGKPVKYHSTHRLMAQCGRRILHAIHDFPPRHAAGSELYALALCRELAARHHVTVLC